MIQASVAKPYEIPTGSMVPTIQTNDRIIANRLIYRFRDIERGDIIVFDPPPSATRSCGDADGGDIPFVKRVIGLPGDKVEVHEDGADAGQRHAAVVDEALPNPPQRGGRATRTFEVPPDRLLVLGDNRPGSLRLAPVDARPVRARGQRHRPGRDHLLAAVATWGSWTSAPAAHPRGRPRLGRGVFASGSAALHLLSHVEGCASATLNMVWRPAVRHQG